jgi:ketosteroid isomerase-like protein
MSAADEAEIQTLIDALTDAWKRGDAKAYGARVMPDATFTNVNGEFYVGREAFDRRHAEVFSGVFRGTTLAMTINSSASSGRTSRSPISIPKSQARGCARLGPRSAQMERCVVGS